MLDKPYMQPYFRGFIEDQRTVSLDRLLKSTKNAKKPYTERSLHALVVRALKEVEKVLNPLWLSKFFPFKSGKEDIDLVLGAMLKYYYWRKVLDLRAIRYAIAIKKELNNDASSPVLSSSLHGHSPPAKALAVDEDILDDDERFAADFHDMSERPEQYSPQAHRDKQKYKAQREQDQRHNEVVDDDDDDDEVQEEICVRIEYTITLITYLCPNFLSTLLHPISLRCIHDVHVLQDDDEEISETDLLDPFELPSPSGRWHSPFCWYVFKYLSLPAEFVLGSKDEVHKSFLAPEAPTTAITLGSHTAVDLLENKSPGGSTNYITIVNIKIYIFITSK